MTPKKQHTFTPEAALARISRLVQQRRDALTEIDGLVRMLRSPGLDGHCYVTWEQVGDVLGVTPQAVQKRYSDLSWGGDA